MDIAKPRVVIVATLAGVVLSSMAWSAEAPMRGVPREGGVPRAFAQQPATLGLSNPNLKLSDSQRERLQKIMDGYVQEERALNLQYSAPGATRGRDAALASKQAHERMMTVVDQVLDASQRKILKAEQDEQKAKLDQAMKAAHPGGPAAAGRPAPGMNQLQGR